MKTIISATVVALLLAGCSGGTSSTPSTTTEASPAAVAMTTIAGRVQVSKPNISIYASPVNADGTATCKGINGFDDMAMRAPVVITDEKGAILGKSTITKTSSANPLDCSLWFSIQVPSGHPVYGIAVGSRDPVILTAAEAAKPIGLRLGN
jgi:hypothetical protein